MCSSSSVRLVPSKGTLSSYNYVDVVIGSYKREGHHNTVVGSWLGGRKQFVRCCRDSYPTQTTGSEMKTKTGCRLFVNDCVLVCIKHKQTIKMYYECIESLKMLIHPFFW